MRLKLDIFSGEYSKKEEIIRKILVFLFRIPIVGILFLKLFSIFFSARNTCKKINFFNTFKNKHNIYKSS